MLIKKWGPPVFFSCALLLLALLPSQHAVQLYKVFFSFFHVDPQWVGRHSTEISNYGHLTGFAFLAFLFSLHTQLHFGKVTALCVTLAATIELAQILAPDRQGRFDDLALGIGGVLIALLCLKLFSRM